MLKILSPCQIRGVNGTFLKSASVSTNDRHFRYTRGKLSLQVAINMTRLPNSTRLSDAAVFVCDA